MKKILHNHESLYKDGCVRERGNHSISLNSNATISELYTRVKASAAVPSRWRWWNLAGEAEEHIRIKNKVKQNNERKTEGTGRKIREGMVGQVKERG